MHTLCHVPPGNLGQQHHLRGPQVVRGETQVRQRPTREHLLEDPDDLVEFSYCIPELGMIHLRDA